MAQKIIEKEVLLSLQQNNLFRFSACQTRNKPVSRKNAFFLKLVKGYIQEKRDVQDYTKK